MAVTRILRLSNSPPLQHCRRTFSTALNHTRVVFPTTINRESKTCSKRLIGSFIRHFSTSPVVSDDMQKSVSEDLIWSVKSLRQDVESLRKEFSLLSEVVGIMQKSIAQRIVIEKDDGNDYVGESVLNDNEKTIEKSSFSEAMTTHFNTDDNEKVAENMDDFTAGDFSEDILDSDSEGNNEKATEKMSDFSEAMATHFNTKIVISQDNKAAEKMSDFSEEIQKSDIGDSNEKVTAEEMISDFSEEIQKGDTEGNSEKATEKMSDFSEDMATHDTEMQNSDTEGNKKTVPAVKEQDPLLKEIESEIACAEDFSRLSSQGVDFPNDFPFMLKNDVPGVASITLKRYYKSKIIVVTVSTPSVFTSITAENYQYYKNSNFIMQLTVEIFPVNSERRDIAFNCSAYSSGFLIEKVYGSEYDTKGLVFSELNDSLRKEFKKYLEMRGITPSTTNSIFGYMLDKVNREKLRCLYKLKELLEA